MNPQVLLADRLAAARHEELLRDAADRGLLRSRGSGKFNSSHVSRSLTSLRRKPANQGRRSREVPVSMRAPTGLTR